MKSNDYEIVADEYTKEIIDNFYPLNRYRGGRKRKAMTGKYLSNNGQIRLCSYQLLFPLDRDRKKIVLSNKQ